MPELFIHALLTFGPSWVPGSTVVVLMDYDMWEHSGEAGHRCQQAFIESNRQCFERLPHSRHAVFRYIAEVDLRKVLAESLSMTLSQREREIESIKGSLSWRLTSPLRRVRDAARGSFSDPGPP